MAFDLRNVWSNSGLKRLGDPLFLLSGDGIKFWSRVCRPHLKDQHNWQAMMTSSNGNIVRVTGPLCGEFTGHRWIPGVKGQWRRALMFSLFWAWTNGWVNNREAGDLRHHRAIVMKWYITYKIQGVKRYRQMNQIYKLLRPKRWKCVEA